MTIQRLREIAAHHRQVAEGNRWAARKFKNVLPHVAKTHGEEAAFHEVIARDLTEHADAISTLTPLLTSQT